VSRAHRCTAFGGALPTLSLLAGFSGCFGTPTPLAPGLTGSVGLPHHGVQTEAIELPESGDGFARYRNQGGYYWGQPALVNGILEAARRVDLALPGGAPLVVGDLSARYGGKISRHQSHRSGRDVDLLWYVTKPDGTSLRNSSFVHLEGDGMGRLPGRGLVRLDVPREWMLIKALLASDQLMVQWLYSSRVVEELVIEHALAEGEDSELIWRAQNVMMQPLEGLPHDDHLHLRIACPPQTPVQGCEGGGPYWSWLASPSGLEGSEVDVELLGGGGGAL
jgi:penicillin-insensitive murein DD-endopeptidase